MMKSIALIIFISSFSLQSSCPYNDGKSSIRNLVAELKFSAELERIHKDVAAVPTSTFKSTTKPTTKSTSKTTTKPSFKPSSRKPSIKPTISKSSIKSTSSKPSLKPSSRKPSIKPTSSKPSIKPTSSKPSIKPTNSKPSIKPTSSKPSIKPSSSKPVASTLVQTTFCKKTSGIPFTATAAGTCAAYKSIQLAFNNAIPPDDFSKSNLFGQAIRLAFHDAGEFNRQKGDKLRSDGCLSNDFANKFLSLPTSLVNTVMEPIWQANCDKISRADFWVLFAILSIKAAEPTNTIKFQYQYGRKDTTTCNIGAGRLPSAQGGLGLIHKFFVNQMGLTMEDAVALLGGHTIGHVHTDSTASGYGFPGDPSVDNLINAWDQTPAIFDNNYYNSMIAVPWSETPQPYADGSFDMTKNIWIIPQSGQQTIMLNTDMVLGFNITLLGQGSMPVGVPEQFCAPGLPPPLQCLTPEVNAVPPTFALVEAFNLDNTLFLNSFAASFLKMSTAGYGPTELTSIDLSTC